MAEVFIQSYSELKTQDPVQVQECPPCIAKVRKDEKMTALPVPHPNQKNSLFLIYKTICN